MLGFHGSASHCLALGFAYFILWEFGILHRFVYAGPSPGVQVPSSIIVKSFVGGCMIASDFNYLLASCLAFGFCLPYLCVSVSCFRPSTHHVKCTKACLLHISRFSTFFVSLSLFPMPTFDLISTSSFRPVRVARAGAISPLHGIDPLVTIKLMS